MNKDERRNRFSRRKAKHVRDIRHADFISNEREEVTIGAGSHSKGAAYNVMKARNIRPITRGGGWIGDNPRYRDERHSVKRELVEV